MRVRYHRVCRDYAACGPSPVLSSKIMGNDIPALSGPFVGVRADVLTSNKHTGKGRYGELDFAFCPFLLLVFSGAFLWFPSGRVIFVALEHVAVWGSCRKSAVSESIFPIWICLQLMGYRPRRLSGKRGGLFYAAISRGTFVPTRVRRMMSSSVL